MVAATATGCDGGVQVSPAALLAEAPKCGAAGGTDRWLGRGEGSGAATGWSFRAELPACVVLVLARMRLRLGDDPPLSREGRATTENVMRELFKLGGLGFLLLLPNSAVARQRGRTCHRQGEIVVPAGVDATWAAWTNTKASSASLRRMLSLSRVSGSLSHSHQSAG